jgi:hypothetical protein
VSALGRLGAAPSAALLAAAQACALRGLYGLTAAAAAELLAAFVLVGRCGCAALCVLWWPALHVVACSACGGLLCMWWRTVAGAAHSEPPCRRQLPHSI